MDAQTWPRIGLPLAPLRPRFATEWLSTLERSSWPEPPRGHDRPAMLVPGFLAGDATLMRMAAWLREGDFVLARSGIRWNTGCMEPTVEELVRRLEEAVEAAGRPAVLIGQSRGGTIARVLSVLRPDLVDTLVTLGSPLRDQLAVHLRVWPSILTVGALGTFGVPGMFSVRCLSGTCCAHTRAAMSAPFPDEVPFVSFYSRTDEIVRWQSCLDPAAQQVEIDSSHLGMAFCRSVWLAVAAALD